MHNTGVRLTVTQFSKAESLARSLGVSRNRLFGLLIENAELQEVKLTMPVSKLSVHEKSSVEILGGTDAAFTGIHN